MLQTYGRPSDLVFTHGKGAKLFSADGREFLDFAAGIAVNSIGHGHPHWVAAVKAQVLRIQTLLTTLPDGPALSQPRPSTLTPLLQPYCKFL